MTSRDYPLGSPYMYIHAHDRDPFTFLVLDVLQVVLVSASLWDVSGGCHLLIAKVIVARHIYY